MLPSLEQLQTIAVIGAGTMGHGIAQVAAQLGAQVRLFDALAGAARSGVDRIAKNLAKGVELGKVSAADRDATLARISTCDQLAEACKDVDCVIEAIPELVELKRETFAVIDDGWQPGRGANKAGTRRGSHNSTVFELR